jgi:response regulator RpfG family c-di-GMP phosphodiesterase
MARRPLHDIGKIGVSDTILRCQQADGRGMGGHAPHSEDRVRHAQRHGFLSGASEIVLEHHERLTARAIRGLAADDPAGARILSRRTR